jgi:hypothetical protein
MENLNLENFWNPQRAQTPEAVDVFCKWVDEYKKRNNWKALFNEGICNYPINADIMEKSHAPKFHDLPWAMQMGILQEFAASQPAGISFGFIGLLYGCANINDQKELASEYFKELQRKINGKV